MADRCASLVLALVALLPACGGTAAERWHERWDIPEAPLSEIFDERDCTALESRIVMLVSEITAMPPRADRLERSVLVQAAFHRMVALECPQAFRH